MRPTQLGITDDEQDQRVAYCLYQPHWHQGVNGILAGRIKDQTNRPTIIFARGDNKELKGSARSIKGFHIRDALEAIDVSVPGLIKKFGGHAMAAGLTIDEQDFDDFAHAFESFARRSLDDDALAVRVHTDGLIALEAMNMDTAELLEQAGPWGQGFPEPLFEGEFGIIEQLRIGSDQRHLKLKLDYAGTAVDAVAFNQDEDIQPANNHKVFMTYRMAVNRFRGMETLQLIIQDILRSGNDG